MTEQEKLDAIALMTLDLYADARTGVPEHGRGFNPVYARLNLEGWGYDLTDIILSIVAVPDVIPNADDERYLELRAYRLPLGYCLSRIIKVGSKQTLLEYIQTETLHRRILNALPQMADNMND